MERIIAGQFRTRDSADSAAALMAQYVDAADICIFHNNAPGQHDAFVLGGDEETDPGATGAENSSVGSAVAAGLAAGAVGALGGPVVALTAAAVGAYTGSLVGALDGMGDQHDGALVAGRRPGCVMLSVRIASPDNEARVIATLRAEGAAGIEQADGEWRNGDWLDFDPVKEPRLVVCVPD